ncbi:MAG: hypothetical protein GKR97_16440 [Rhizobiaceae bacterium]|nr:hypothetical protein [Rhizobiaceae bacterium]
MNSKLFSGLKILILGLSLFSVAGCVSNPADLERAKQHRESLEEANRNNR